LVLVLVLVLGAGCMVDGALCTVYWVWGDDGVGVVAGIGHRTSHARRAPAPAARNCLVLSGINFRPWSAVRWW
jgi:hypothetical protein